MHDHQVQFYVNAEFLVERMSDYIGDALASDNMGIVIATEPHVHMLETSLKRRGLLDGNGHATNGSYIPLHIDQMLHFFMDADVPDEQRFYKAIGTMLGEAAASAGAQRKLVLYAEMAAALSTAPYCFLHPREPYKAALQLEQFFNTLQRDYAFSLLCGYPLGAFPRVEDGQAFAEICALHSKVEPAEGYDRHASVETLQRTIASLQQQANSLDNEVRDRQQIERALREVNVDVLTGLPNRNVFHDRLEMDIKKAQRSGHPLALLFVDLDHFKEINDTMGHQIGDLLLKQVGQRLQAYVRDSDTVARLGGDEFTITLSELRDLDSVTDVAQKIRNDLAQPFRLGKEMAYISASIGITLFPRDAHNAGELLRNADQAMYQSKYQGRNRFTYFTSSMQEAAQRRMALSNDLRRALEQEQLDVFYQPIIDMQTGRVSKAEALARWHHREHGPISPLDFIPIAEHTGLIVALGDWVFQQALACARRWRLLNPQLTVNVNVSPAQFYYADADNHHRPAGTKADGKRPYTPELGIEITESLLLASSTGIMKQLLAYQQAGVQVSLDDFGTGYSSLSYLRKFDLDFLKIDQSFVYNFEHDAANVALCEAIIVMAHKLGLKVVAEGVETHEQYRLLHDAGCDFAQGFLLGEPVPAETFEALLKHEP